jgi:hypothetical protein
MKKNANAAPADDDDDDDDDEDEDEDVDVEEREEEFEVAAAAASRGEGHHGDQLGGEDDEDEDDEEDEEDEEEEEEEEEDEDGEDDKLNFSVPSSGAAKKYQLIVERCEAIQQVIGWFSKAALKCCFTSRFFFSGQRAARVPHSRREAACPARGQTKTVSDATARWTQGQLQVTEERRDRNLNEKTTDM